MDEGVRLFLENLGMLKYYNIFCARGFDLESDIPHITLFDLENSLMIDSKSDRAIIFANAKNYKPSAEYDLFDWLHRHSLDHYYINFIQSELTDLHAVARIQLPNEDLFDELEIVLPGHKKRLERAVASLRQEGIGHVPTEIPVTQGWWGKPRCLPQAKFDFLCVSANLCASQQPENKVSIDFMVDSGSDVSTVQEKTLENLNLELIGPVYSCGIHGGNYTNLYKAQLEVGDVKLDIEVLASNYDSLGSRIVRHFRHVIDGKRHIWLKGNYKDPLPVILPTPSPAKFSSGASTSITNPTKTLPSITKPPLPSSTSISSSSSEIISLSSPSDRNAGTEKCTQQTVIIPSQYESGPLSSSKSAAYEPFHNNVTAPCSQSLYQSESIVQKTTASNNFISLLSTNSNNQNMIHCQNTFKTNQDSVSSNSSTTNSVHKWENSAKSIDCRHEPLSQIIESVVCEQEKDIKCKKETNDLDGFEKKKSQQLEDISVNFKSLGHKRPSLLSSGNHASPKKIQKTDNVDVWKIPPTFKDTDDDIDNINAFVIKDIHHSNSNQHSTGCSRPPELYQYLPSFVHRKNLVRGDVSNSVDFDGEKDVPEGVVHILSESDDDDEEHLQDDKSLEMMSQNSNFMPGVGTSVIIPVDDLEKNVFISPIKDVSNDCK